jgi:hypothetical protein
VRLRKGFSRPRTLPKNIFRFHKSWAFIDQLSDYELLKDDTLPQTEKLLSITFPLLRIHF